MANGVELDLVAQPNDVSLQVRKLLGDGSRACEYTGVRRFVEGELFAGRLGMHGTTLLA